MPFSCAFLHENFLIVQYVRMFLASFAHIRMVISHADRDKRGLGTIHECHFGNDMTQD